MVDDVTVLLPGRQRLAVGRQRVAAATEAAQLPPALDVPEANHPVISLARKDCLAAQNEVHTLRPGMAQTHAQEPRDGAGGKWVALGILAQRLDRFLCCAVARSDSDQQPDAGVATVPERVY